MNECGWCGEQHDETTRAACDAQREACLAECEALAESDRAAERYAELERCGAGWQASWESGVMP